MNHLSNNPQKNTMKKNHFVLMQTAPLVLSFCSSVIAAEYPVKLAEPLKYHDESVEITDAGTLRRRYKVWGDYDAEVAAWKALAAQAPARTFRLGCIFLKDAEITCPDVQGADGQPLKAVFSTPPEFQAQMKDRTAGQYSDFVQAFTHGAVKCEWVFETLSGLKWTSTGKNPGWGCQPRAIAEQVEKALAGYKEAKVDMWVWCAGSPKTLNGAPKQKVSGPPYGISYTQWELLGGYNIAICAPHLPLVVHEVNHRYLDNLNTIEGVHLTQFHGLSMMGYERGDLGYDDLLATYRSVYQHIIRPEMWRRFSLKGPSSAKPEPFTGKMYLWKNVREDCWFRLPLLTEVEIAKLIGLPGLKLIAEPKSRFRHFTVPEAGRSLLRSPYSEAADKTDTSLNNVLSLATESCAVLSTATGHWLIVRPEVTDVYVDLMSLRGKGAPLEVAGWINEGVCPLLLLRAPQALAVPAKEIGYFR
jgi:hypothetical protein